MGVAALVRFFALYRDFANIICGNRFTSNPAHLQLLLSPAAGELPRFGTASCVPSCICRLFGSSLRAVAAAVQHTRAEKRSYFGGGRPQKLHSGLEVRADHVIHYLFSL